MANMENLNNITYSEVVKAVASFMQEERDNKPLRIAFLGNITFGPVLTYFKFLCQAEKMYPIIYSGNYDNVMQDVITPQSELYKFKPEIIIIASKMDMLSKKISFQFNSMDSDERDKEIKHITTFLGEVMRHVRANCNSIVLVHNFEIPVYPNLGILDYQSREGQVASYRQINQDLIDIVSGFKNIYVLDIDVLQSRVGYNKFNDKRCWHFGKSPYSIEGSQEIAKEYIKFVNSINGKTKKCLVLDCDNTLWGGIVGEDGIGGIFIGDNYPGSAFSEFQHYISELHGRGVLLAICSKNNEKDVLEVFKQHPNMVLREEHFSAMKINWEDKCKNILSIAKELNIGLESMVFLDDNKFEVEMVNKMLPAVCSLKLPEDPALYADFIRSFAFFDSLIISDEDLSRNQMYAADKKRKIVMSETGLDNIQDYFRYLEMCVSINRMDDLSVARVSQLTLRTNQFNLTTKRYTEAEVRELEGEGADVYCVELKDRFGDSGIIGVYILKYTEGKCVIDSFLLSCRALGRKVETVMIGSCLLRAKENGCKDVIGEYKYTDKNQQVQDFYPEHGFKPLMSDKGFSRYFFDLENSLHEFPDFFKQVEIDGKKAK